jgi:hypothetical protein
MTLSHGAITKIWNASMDNAFTASMATRPPLSWETHAHFGDPLQVNDARV